MGRAWRGDLTPQLARLCQALRGHALDLQARHSEFGHQPRLVIHGDFYAENLIMQGDVIVAVVDFDLARWSLRSLELAEALIYFAREATRRFQHIVYSGFLDLGLIDRFLRAYTEVIPLSDAELRALPHMIRTIWMCASLDPPLRSRVSLDQAADALPEVLALADWASMHAADITQIGFRVLS
jgi:Ser/Thr protein kinase RdoA (MazF antagonist)